MKITAINGSPKAEGISSLIINKIGNLLDEQIETYQAVCLVRTEKHQEDIARILESDILLIVFPLFIDALPFPLIELLTRLESTVCHGAETPRVFAIVNGALDTAQTVLALNMIEHFARRARLPWGYGIGIGAGSLLYNAGENWSKGLASDVHHALCDLVVATKENRSAPNIYVSFKFPRILYKTIANISFLLEAKRNGVKNLRAQPYVTQENSCNPTSDQVGPR